MKELSSLSIDKLQQDILSPPIPPPTQHTVISEYMLQDSNFVGFETIEQQERIYNIASFGIITPGVKSITDFGCGRGDFGSYIKKTINSDIKYIGIDSNQLMINIGTEKYNTQLTDFNLINSNYYELNKSNNVIISDWVFNILNLSVDYGLSDDLDHLEQFKAVLDISLDTCNTGIVFILLNDRTKFDGYIQYNTSEIIQYLDSLNLRYSIDNTDYQDIIRLVIFKTPF